MTEGVKAKGKRIKVMTPEFRVSFPHLFEPRAFENGEPKYSVVMVFDKNTDLKVLKDAAKAALAAKWPDPATRPKNLKNPFRDGSEKEEWEGFGEGVIFVSASANIQHRPGVVNRKRDIITDPSELYPGCYARATVTPYTFDVKGNRGVAFGLNHVQFLRGGEPLAGGGKAQDDFDELPDVDDPFDPGQGDEPFDDFLS